MMSEQNAVEYAMNQMELGNISADEANVLMVQLMGIKVVRGTLPRTVKTALNNAVKNGELGKVKADGLKPEIYHHKNARSRALTEQDRIARASIEAIKGCYA